MGNLPKDIAVNIVSSAIEKWWGKIMTLSIITSIGAWLASKEELLINSNAALYLAVLIFFIVGLWLIHAIRIVFFSGTKKHTYIECDITSINVIEISKNKSNIADYMCQRHIIVNPNNPQQQIGITEMFIVFEKEIYKPVIHITEKVAVNPQMIGSYTGRKAAYISINSNIGLGKFRIEFNEYNA